MISRKVFGIQRCNFTGSWQKSIQLFWVDIYALKLEIGLDIADKAKPTRLLLENRTSRILDIDDLRSSQLLDLPPMTLAVRATKNPLDLPIIRQWGEN